jgi:hypothetical protein
MLHGREKVGVPVDVVGGGGALPAMQKNKKLTFSFGPAVEGIDGRDTIHEHHIREIPIAIGALGCALWDGGLVLTRWLYKNGEALAQKHTASSTEGTSRGPPRILELGCGVGLAGIMAAHFTRGEVVMTDYIPEALGNALYNVGINHVEPDDVPDEMMELRPGYDFSIAPRISVEYLDWDVEAKTCAKWQQPADGSEAAAAAAAAASSKTDVELPKGVSSFSAKNRAPGCFDIILGAELTYNLLSVDSLSLVIDKWLSADGAFYEVLSNDRDGVSTFIQRIESLGFVTQRTDMGGEFVGNFGTRKWSKQENETYSLFCWRRKEAVENEKAKRAGGADE